MEALGMIKKRTDKYINNITDSCSLNEIKKKKLHLAELLISFGEYYQYDWKYHPKEVAKIIEYI